MAAGARSLYLRRYLNVLDARSRDFMWERLIFLQIMLADVGCLVVSTCAEPNCARASLSEHRNLLQRVLTLRAY